MGIFLNGLLGPKISPRVVTRYSPSPSVSIRHTPLPFLRYNPFPIRFYTPVLASPDKAPTPDAGKTVPVRNGINPANAGKNPPWIFMLWVNCVFDNLIVMPFFSSYAPTSLSSCEMVKAITSSPCRSENVRRIVIDLQLDSKAFLSLSFYPLIFAL